MIKYQAKIYKDEDSYSVEFPDLPGCFTCGDTLEHAKAMAKEALSLYLEEARNPRWTVPLPKNRKSKAYYWISPFLEVGIPLLIRQKRLQKGLTQNKMSQLLGISIQQLQKLETPGKSNPTVKTLNRISSVLQAELNIDIAS